MLANNSLQSHETLYFCAVLISNSTIQKLPEFTLLGTDGMYHSPSEYSQKKGLVLIFISNHCIYSRSYIKRIKKLIRKYEKQDIGFFLINSTDASQFPSDTYYSIQAFAKKKNLVNYCLHDETQGIAISMNVCKTLETLVFDSKRTLIYRGAIDDNWADEEKVSNFYLEEAINSLSGHSQVMIPETKAVGAFMKWKMYN